MLLPLDPRFRWDDASVQFLIEITIYFLKILATLNKDSPPRHEGTRFEAAVDNRKNDAGGGVIAVSDKNPTICHPR